MKRLALFLLVALVAVMPAGARMLRGCVSATDGEPEFVVDSIDCRKDLTRVYGRLKGRPHTSSRIDAIVMQTPGAILKECADIDGVDFNRWFQWEDDGQIAVELDFGPVKDARSGEMIFTTPRGKTTVKWSTPAPVRKSKKTERKH